MQEIYVDSSMESFNDGWLFLPPESSYEPEPGKIPDEAITVTLPHAWNAEGWSYEPVSYDEPTGTGWYFKRLSADCQFTAIRFEGVAALCKVYLNGKLIQSNFSAYKPFELELSGLHSDGRDIIAVKVTDKASLQLLPEDCDPEFAKSPRLERWAVPMGSSLYAGGIWRNVWGIKRNKTYMRPPVIRTAPERLTILPEISGNAAGCKLKCSLTLDGQLVANAECVAGERELLLTVDDYREWLPLQPVLYELETTLFNTEGKLIQTIRQPVAFFDLCIRNSDFYLNGRPFFLRGQNGFPHCNVPHDREYITRYVTAIRQQGVEISRFHTEPPSHAWLDECDRQGIMVIFEMALHGSFGCYAYGNADFRKTVLDEMKELLLEYRRHPSIALWSLGNEMIVACERDLGLGTPLFDYLEEWITELRKLDPRPIIANSCSDAANLLPKSVGDVDDVHQYGGWYVENLRDLRHFGEFTQKNDMLFQPCISTESIAAYTNDNGEFFLKHKDVRQKKMVEMRLGKITDFSRQAQEYQAFMLKEYAEEMWRLRHPDSSFAGYIPFGQYTWFRHPFDKGPNGIIPKMIWDTYRNVMSPVHVQFECWDRNINDGGTLSGMLRLFHEDIHLPETTEFTVVISCNDKIFYEESFRLDYHHRVDTPITVGPFVGYGKRVLEINVYHNKIQSVHNNLEFRIYTRPKCGDSDVNMLIYDPAGTAGKALAATGCNGGSFIPRIDDIFSCNPEKSLLLIAPYALDKDTVFQAEKINTWISRGAHVIVFEQNPAACSENIFNLGVGFVKKNQPYWSRWAANLVKHADRADMLLPDHPVFAGLIEDDLRWWNRDTFLAHSYLDITIPDHNDRILSRIGKGLADDELMPVEYDYIEPGYSIMLMERQHANGSVILTSMLIGEKAAIDPVAAKMLVNLINYYRNK